MNGSGPSSIERLLRGIHTDHVETVRGAWMELRATPDKAVPAMLSKLNTPVWAGYPRGPLHKYLGVLLALLDEIDRSAFVAEIARLKATKIHPLHQMTVDLMARRCDEGPSFHIGPDIPVYMADEIAKPQAVCKHLRKWSGTEGLDLATITRIDVIAQHSHLDYLGRYNAIFAGVVLIWPDQKKRSLLRLLYKMGVKFTFYHSVGHHANRNRWGGEFAERERAANIYARDRYCAAHPVSTMAGRTILVPLRPLLRFVIRHFAPQRVRE